MHRRRAKSNSHLPRGSRRETTRRCTPREVREHCRHDEGGARLLEGAMRALGLSARGYARVLKVARTIADLAGEPKIGITHIAESIQYREQPRHLG
jgi:magnesium chelatase family protein